MRLEMRSRYVRGREVAGRAIRCRRWSRESRSLSRWRCCATSRRSHVPILEPPVLDTARPERPTFCARELPYRAQDDRKRDNGGT